jgi:hypothetical protein
MRRRRDYEEIYFQNYLDNVNLTKSSYSFDFPSSIELFTPFWIVFFLIFSQKKRFFVAA